MHGLIFETSIWLLAGSTRFLRIKPPSFRFEIWINRRIRFVLVLRTDPKIWTQRILLSSHISSSYGRINELKEPKHSARNYSTMQQAFYHSLLIGAKLGILQKYKYKFSNTLQFRRTAGREACICQFAPVIRKVWMTRMLNWNTFSMRRLTIQKVWNFFKLSLYASHLVQIFPFSG